jgi:hypothetical protein
VAAAKPASRQASLLDALRNLYLPAGYPASTTPDYLRYQLWTLPAHVTGWISIGLTTSSLLKAVGFSAGRGGGRRGRGTDRAARAWRVSWAADGLAPMLCMLMACRSCGRHSSSGWHQMDHQGWAGGDRPAVGGRAVWARI